MNVFLYPYHFLPRFSELQMNRGRLAEISSALIYFDSITIGRPGDPKDLGLGEVADIIEVSKRHPIGNRNISDLSIGEYAIHAFNDWAQEYSSFLNDYDPLIKNSVLRTVSLSRLTRAAREHASDESERDALQMRSVLAGFISATPGWIDWANSASEVAHASLIDMNASGSLGLSMYYWRHQLLHDPEFLSKADDKSRFEYLQAVFRFDSFLQATLSQVMQMPVVGLCDEHLQVRERHLAKTRPRETPEADQLALRLVARVLTNLPSVIPRSPEAILELRHSLADELGEFRQGVRDATNDMMYQFGDEGPSEADIDQVAQRTFVRPLRDISKRLERPGRQLLANLASSEAMLTSTVVLSTGILNHAQGLANLALGASVALLASAAATWKERKSIEQEKPNVAFLLKAAR